MNTSSLGLVVVGLVRPQLYKFRSDAVVVLDPDFVGVCQRFCQQVAANHIFKKTHFGIDAILPVARAVYAPVERAHARGVFVKANPEMLRCIGELSGCAVGSRIANFRGSFHYTGAHVVQG